ncbi:MAG: glycosyltransferase family 1 protein [Chloroflexi bacterium]|uniref:Glycosyltransferase family 1 protein n=1 Tax=Candidatus Thermofonsia Clade 3 bacterium TaxID=2364212 RepID=A0A2M8QGC3_9CHLR|nr:glycosyltransferase family 4 protein [Candidatus Roseilinea sp. NK_OTU-006]PJF48856.1 MAG: glycosyltransferase family 1 protein [Candidatus Thermofonsia Clade 3 bacterium]RMG64458.1 MAG: glycosyltransferase family 1 protein [Chloroflexota bacterium]
MRILQVLTYYRPHISGLTIYVERLSRGLARAGHQVTVLTSQYDPHLARSEVLDGVSVVRAPVLARISKGVIMPTFGVILRQLLPQFDLVHLHLPQFDGAGIAINARLFGKPSLLTIHGDIRLPGTWFNRIVQPVINLMNDIAGYNVDRIVSYTEDFARHSRYLSRYAHKLAVIPPPVEMELPSPSDIADFRQKWRVSHEQHPLIGMCARLATEKGVEVLVRALAIIRETRPNARVIFAGPHRNVIGEEAYARRLQPHFDALGDAWTFVGSLQGRALSAFFASCDVTVLPSLNSTESFGLVQVESMLCGTPSICSDLPGVRVPVQTTGMGEVTPVGDASALAEAILRVCDNRAAYVKPRDFILQHYSTARTVSEYEMLYQALIRACASQPNRA